MRESPAGIRPVACANEARHGDRRVTAVALLSWPDGRYKPTTACSGCLTEAVFLARTPSEDGHPLLVSPVAEPAEVRQYRQANAQRLEERLGYALSDPGSITPRAESPVHEDGWTGRQMESLPRWQRRAVLQVLEEENHA